MFAGYTFSSASVVDFEQVNVCWEPTRLSYIRKCSENLVRFPNKFHGRTCTHPAFYLLKVNNRSTRTRCEICSKLTIKTPERRQ